MSFAGAGSADEDHVASCVEEGADGKFANQAFIDRRVGEDEFADILKDREFGAAHAIADRARLPWVRSARIRLARKGKISSRRLRLLTGYLVEARAHAVELEFSHGLEDLVAFHQATFLMLS